MTAVIMGLVAVVLLVLVVVALGMRSMNRRESALSSERLKAMAENKGPKPRRPAEETFFESFPQGFDAFEEPSDKEKGAPKQRPAGGRPAAKPGGRQATRPAQRGGGKQPAAPRGRRGVDEWGESDDYDDEYWSRVRADDGGFSGPGARMATPRPVGRPSNTSTGDTPNAQAPAPSRAADPDAATVQAPLPQRAGSDRQSGRKSSRVTPASAAADQKTVAFSAPTPDVLGGLGTPAPVRPLATPSADLFDASPATGSFDASPATGSFDASPATGSFSTSPASDSFTPPPRPAGSAASRTGRSGRSSRSARRSAAPAADTGAGRASGSVEAPLGTGPLGGGLDATPSTAPATGSYTTGTGPFDTVLPPAGTASPAASAADPLTSSTPPTPSTGSFDSWAAYEAPRSNDSYDLPHGSTGLFTTADTGPSYTVPPTVPPTTPPVTPIPSSPTPPAASETSWPSAAAPSTGPATSPSWSGVRDILDDPEPARGGATWPGAEAYQPPAAQPPGYDGYSSYSNDPGYSAGSSSYEVSTGWATIDDADSAAGPTGAQTGPGRTVSPYESAGYDVPSGQSPYGYDQYQGQTNGNGQQSWPEQNTGGSWPSYDELYGNAPQSTSARRGSHRQPETEPDYPDYYR